MIAMRFLIDKILQVCYNSHKTYCKDGRRFKSSSRDGGELYGNISASNAIAALNNGHSQTYV